MTSWTPISKCYVFIQHGGEYRPLGVLAEGDAGFRFAYAQSWLSSPDAFSVDPLNLPLGEQEYHSPRRCWGCFQDAGADNWGQRVLLATHRQAPANQIEWLISAKGTGVGSLIFSASRNQVPVIETPPELALVSELMVQAEKLIEEGTVDKLQDLPPHIHKALVYGSSMGGARPKFTVAHEGSEWICKLSRTDDTFNQPIAEMASLQMAVDCGLDVPRHMLHHVAGKAMLMIERFDRGPDGSKRHYLSGNSLINADRARDGDPEGAMSYIRLADILSKVSSKPAADRRELFTRMVLNVAIGNTDDHLKNHGFLHAGGERFTLAPVFDVLPHPKQTDLMALSIGRYGREASLVNALSMADRFGLSHQEALDAVDRVLAVTAKAGTYFSQAGATTLESGLLHNIAYSKRMAYLQSSSDLTASAAQTREPTPGR